jgi:hypothetical protein
VVSDDRERERILLIDGLQVLCDSPAWEKWADKIGEVEKHQDPARWTAARRRIRASFRRRGLKIPSLLRNNRYRPIGEW